MRILMVVAGVVMAGVASGADAPQPTGRADLEVLAQPPFSRPVAARVAFVKSSANCPDESSILHMTGGSLAFHRVMAPRSNSISGRGFAAVDDTTYEAQISTRDCRMNFAVRQQVRQPDGSWESQAVRRFHRPSLTPEERNVAMRQFVDSARQRPVAPVNDERRKELQGAYAEAGSLNQGVATISGRVVFENAPSACIEALGTMASDQDGLTFLFLTGLPGEMNRFVIERFDTDDDRARLHFLRGDCRFEIIVSASVLNGDQWIRRVIAPYARSKFRIVPGPSDARPPWLDRTD